MTRSLRSRWIPKLAVVSLLAIFATTICITPTELHAKRVEELSMPGGGGAAPGVTPGQGDDDQPTGDGEGGRRSSVAMSEPVPGNGGGSPEEPSFRRFKIVKNWFIRGESLVKRLVGFVP